MEKPRQSLLQYQQPIEVFNADSNITHKGKKQHLYDSRLAIDELLNNMFPPQSWEENGKFYKKLVSVNPPSRDDVSVLQKDLQYNLVLRQARTSGICPIREELHRQCFDEIIREVTLDSPERGLLLIRVRDQLYMTNSSYQTLYESSLTFSMRKQLQSEQGIPELKEQITELQEKKNQFQDKLAALKKKKQILQKNNKDRKMAEDKKRAQEIDFLKYQANHLQNFLRSVNQASK